MNNNEKNQKLNFVKNELTALCKAVNKLVIENNTKEYLKDYIENYIKE